MNTFTLSSKNPVRTGTLHTAHGDVATPLFMPVGTRGAVKGVSPTELRAVGSQIVLGNTYHLHLRPGEGTVQALGGLQQFSGWNGPMLTDSGGFQVFSLGERSMSGGAKQATRQVTEEGVRFRSHADGSEHLITPEESMQIQAALGADIIMAFDQPVYGMSSDVQAREAMERSMRWLERCVAECGRLGTSQQLFGIVQGGIHKELHTASAQAVVAQNLPGNAIGGLSVGESKEAMREAVESIVSLLPADKPRYFMGLGDPYDVIDAVRRGIDMFDCVAPSRLGRHGVIWMTAGDPEAEAAFWVGDAAALQAIDSGDLKFVRWNLHNARFAEDPGVLPGGIVPFSLGTLRHYVKSQEMLAWRHLTLHNIALLHRIVALVAGRAR